jgi:dienelactone hydrolase
MRIRSIELTGLWLVIAVLDARAADAPLAEYFRNETAKLASRPLLGIDSAEAWKARRPELQRRLRSMLGLDPWPEKTNLAAKVTGTAEQSAFVVEKVLYQSRPGLYVTANLYRPKTVETPLPAILYVCGHSRVEKDGVIYGCKAYYQHHAAWYAANGYICLVLDTLQLGELPGLHHGLHRQGMWWWQSRGYTPAGVEAWNAIRGIDYLISRPDVDQDKIGVTGRSGGGATSWWVGALDDRVAAVVPVAGITDLQNHVADGIVDGHCDCMYFVNTERWDFPTLAALVAPKPMLVENTNKDPIFPEDGVRRVYRQLEKVYQWYGARDRLDLVIGQGGHVDSEEVRHPSFAFMNKWLKGKEESISEPERKVPIEALKVLGPGEVPADNHNATIQETFVAKAETPPVPASTEAWDRLRSRWLNALRTEVFQGWPDKEEIIALNPNLVLDQAREGIRLRAFDFTSQQGIRLRLWLLAAAGTGDPKRVTLQVVDEPEWRSDWAGLFSAWLTEPASAPQLARLEKLRDELRDSKALAVLAPRGIGPTAWPAERETAVRRRFYLLGQTLDGMRVWDVRRALAMLRAIPARALPKIALSGSRPAASWVLWAAVFEPEVESVTLDHAPATVREGPAYLNLERILDMPQAITLLAPRPVRLTGTPWTAWAWAIDWQSRLGPDQGRLIFPDKP